MIEVFKTNISDYNAANRVIKILNAHFPGCRINMDLQDCDNILRIEGNNFMIDKIMGLVEDTGYQCAILV